MPYHPPSSAPMSRTTPVAVGHAMKAKLPVAVRRRLAPTFFPNRGSPMREGECHFTSPIAFACFCNVPSSCLPCVRIESMQMGCVRSHLTDAVTRTFPLL